MERNANRFLPACRAVAVVILAALAAGLPLGAQTRTAAAPATRPSISHGRTTTVTDANLLAGCQGSRVSAVGTITATDGTVWIVPAVTSFKTGTKATDLYNDCSGVRLANIGALAIDNVPVVEVDPGGDVVTGYIFDDNYYELSINGVLIAIDPVPYTPFNSSVVRFRVKRPYTIAVKLVDWEENLGLGSENNQGTNYHPGDGGFIASFSDGTVTDPSWRAQVFYISPLADSNGVVEMPDGTRSTAGISSAPVCDGDCYAAHYPIPDTWPAPAFDDHGWPAASVFSEATVGVDNKPAYTNFIPQFSGAGARFIWSSNLILDNVVLLRKTVGSTTAVPTVDRGALGDAAFTVSPNPAGDALTMQLNLRSDGDVKIELFDPSGRGVAKPYEGRLSAGEHAMRWDCRDVGGMPLAAGIYLLRVKQGDMVISRPVVIVH